MTKTSPLFLLSLVLLLFTGCPSDDDQEFTPVQEALQLAFARIGDQAFNSGDRITPTSQVIALGFTAPVANRDDDQFVLTIDGAAVAETEAWNAAGTEVTITVADTWRGGPRYLLSSRGPVVSADARDLPGLNLSFSIAIEPLRLLALRAGGEELPMTTDALRTDVPVDGPIELAFSHPVVPSASAVRLSGPGASPVEVTAISDSVLRLSFSEPLRDFTVYDLALTQVLGGEVGRVFEPLNFDFRTGPSAEPDFPVISDEELMTKVQEQTFRYFWDFAEPNSGMARERNTSGRLVTSGGSGFGLMAMVVGVERDFITLDQAIERWQRVVGFLETADRFHGAWSHWINGETGEVIPFSPRDNGGDLVETAFLVQGLLTVREYLKQEAPAETELIDRITTLWEGVEWDWYTKGEGETLYWHWSPDQEFAINLRIAGHNETQLVYVLAAASPTHPIEPELYASGYARNGNFRNGGTYYGIELPLGPGRGGPLFFSHYSYLGLDPRELRDEYANYWEQNIAHSRINHEYVVANPRGYYGYTEESWGLTASDGEEGYHAHSPSSDRGVITPTAALSSLPYTPEESLAALEHFYYDLGDRLWGEYGFYDAFRPESNWVASSYLAIDQGPIVIMIENYRTGLVWETFMRAPEVRAGLEVLGFRY